MPKVEQHDLREYYITTVLINLATTATSIFNVPRAGYLARAIWTNINTIAVDDTVLTFVVGAATISPTMTVVDAGVAGTSHVVDFPRSAASYCREAEDLDLIAVGAVITIESDQAGTGLGKLVLVISP
jgi:hypothetical protein